MHPNYFIWWFITHYYHCLFHWSPIPDWPVGALSIGLLCPFDIFSSFFEDFLTFGHSEIFQTHIFPAQTLGSTISLWSLGSFQEIRVFRSQDLRICVLVASRATLLPDAISPFPKTSWKRRDYSSCLCWQLSMQCYFNFIIRKKKNKKQLSKEPWNPKTLFIFLILISSCSRLTRGCEQMLVIFCFELLARLWTF